MFTSRRRLKLVYDIVTYGVITAMAVFSLAPLLWAFLTSLKAPSDIITATLHYLPPRPTLYNYITLWEKSAFPRLIINSAVVATITTFVCLLLGSLAAYSISRYRFRGRGGLMVFLLAIRMFPFVLVLVPIFIMLRKMQLLDTRRGWRSPTPRSSCRCASGC